MPKVIVITGASSGIGAATAELLASRGASVVLVARREAQLRAVAARCGDQAFPVVADMTVREQVRGVVVQAIERFGRIDVWVNNVGQGITRQPSELTDQDIDEMMRVNVKTAMYGIQEVLPHFRSRGEGHLVTISSILGRVPYAVYRSAYNGAKHFLNALIANLREELAAAYPGIRVSLVSPGAVRTEFRQHAFYAGPSPAPLPDAQSPEEVAAVIAQVIESRRPDVYTRAGTHARVVRYFDELGQDP
ncbi:MAG: SDR family oxidoreductase [Gemmatimonadales bacterium]